MSGNNIKLISVVSKIELLCYIFNKGNDGSVDLTRVVNLTISKDVQELSCDILKALILFWGCDSVAHSNQGFVCVPGGMAH